MKVTFSTHWLSGGALAAGHGGQLVRLLRALRGRRSLREAAEASDLSYRFAWGLLTAASREFGAPLVEMKRGSGAALTEAGLRLLALDEKIEARLAPVLARLGAEFQPELDAVSGKAKAALQVHASHDLALGMLKELAAARGVTMELHFQGSSACLEDLARKRCDVAGFHVSASLGEGFGPLRPDRHCVIQFALREQGLIVGKGKRVSALRDLTRKSVRFINRQAGSGTRSLLDALLAREGIAPAAVRGYADEEYTHLAVAATIASGHADAGFGIRAAAAEYGLGFVPVATESYCLATARATYESAAFTELLALLGSRAFRSRAGALPGYDVKQSGAPLEFSPQPEAKRK